MGSPDSPGSKRRAAARERRRVHRDDKKLYCHRCLVEVFFHTLAFFRRIASRYEKTARNCLAVVHLACALQWLRPYA